MCFWEISGCSDERVLQRILLFQPAGQLLLNLTRNQPGSRGQFLPLFKKTGLLQNACRQLRLVPQEYPGDRAARLILFADVWIRRWAVYAGRCEGNIQECSGG